MSPSRFDKFINSLFLLLGLSAASALIIFFIPNLVRVIIPNCNELACLVPFLLSLGLQWILVIPTTVFVVYFYKKQLGHDSLHTIHPVIYVLIPLVLNIIAAGPIFIPFFLEAIWKALMVFLFSA